MIYRYLLEIKYRVFFSCVAWCFVMINCYFFKETLLYIFTVFSTMKSNNDNLLYFLTTDIAEVFVTYLQLSYHVANQITIIFVACQVFTFLSAGLHMFEHAYFKTIIVIAIICWGIFIFAFNNFIFPASWHFFFKFQEFFSFQSLTFYFEAKLIEYFKFYKSMYYLCNLVYQTIILFFIFLDLFKTNLLIIQKFRKILYFSFFVLSTFVTPPEIFYQITISICIIVIYELTTIHMVFKTELIKFKWAIN